MKGRNFFKKKYRIRCQEREEFDYKTSKTIQTYRYRVAFKYWFCPFWSESEYQPWHDSIAGARSYALRNTKLYVERGIVKPLWEKVRK